MKTFSIAIIITAFSFLNLHTYSQSVGSTAPHSGGALPPLTAGYNQPAGSVFAYMPVSSTTAHTSDLLEGWKCYQSFSGVSGSFNTVTVWAMQDISGSQTIPRSVRVEVYNAGATPGSLVSSTTLYVTPINTGINFWGLYDVWEYTMVIPVTNLSSGWISVQALSGTPTFYWLNTFATPIHPFIQTYGASSNTANYGLAMCLSNPAPVPFSKWAIVAVFILLIGAVSFRFVRRMF